MVDPWRENDIYRRFLATDAAIAGLAGQQHGIVGLGQLTQLGLTARAVQHRAAVKRLHRIHRGVYSLAPPNLLTGKGRWMAAVLACGEGAVLSHRTAAALHELRRTDRAKIDVTVPKCSRRVHQGIEVHRSGTLTAQDITTVDNIPCTTVARTLLDLAEVVRLRPLERAFDQADILEVLNLQAIQDQLRRNPKRRGAEAVRAVLNNHYIGHTPTWSELEEAFLAFCRAWDIPEPHVNAWIDPGDGEPAIRVDFLWRAEMLVVQTDGHRTHRTRQAFEHDRRDDQRLMVAGVRTIRTTWRQINREPGRLAAAILALLRAAAPLRPRLHSPAGPG